MFTHLFRVSDGVAFTTADSWILSKFTASKSANSRNLTGVYVDVANTHTGITSVTQGAYFNIAPYSALGNHSAVTYDLSTANLVNPAFGIVMERTSLLSLAGEQIDSLTGKRLWLTGVSILGGPRPNALYGIDLDVSGAATTNYSIYVRAGNVRLSSPVALTDGTNTITVAEMKDAWTRRVTTWTAPLQFAANVASLRSYTDDATTITTTAPHILKIDAVTTLDDSKSLRLQNTTAATSTVNQKSPVLVFEGQGWKTGVGAATKKLETVFQVGSTNTTAPLHYLSLAHSSNNGAYQEAVRFQRYDAATTNVIFSVDGTFVSSPYAVSIQSAAGTDSWLEILNGVSGNGCFFGMSGNNFELWSYQGGDLNFYTDTAAASGVVRMKLAANGDATFYQNVNLTDAKNVVLTTTTGQKIGTATNQKLAFHNSTPVIQRAGAAQAAVATTAATNVVPYGYTTQTQADAIVTLVNEMRDALVEKGLIKGSA
jgi:hypothetical protein